MKRVAILTQFFPPEPCAAANRMAALAASLRDAGHEVTVVTGFANFPAYELAPGDAGVMHRSERCDGFDVERLYTMVPKRTRGGRALVWLSLAVAAICYLLFTKRRFDVIVVTSPPITLALPAILGKLRHGAALVTDIRDVHPDLGVKIGVWTERSLAARTVQAVADALYHASNLVVGVTRTAMQRIALRGIPSERLYLAPNGFDAIRAVPSERPPGGRFEVAFAGNYGIATGLDVVVEAALLLAEDSSIHFTIVGGGVDLPRIQRRLAESGAPNVTLAGVLPRERALGVIAAADAAVVPLRREIVDSLPTKLFDAFFVGTPVVLSASGEAAELVEASGGGLCARAEDPQALVDALRRLQSDPEAARSMGAKGKQFVERHFDRARIMRGFVARIEALGASRTRMPAADAAVPAAPLEN